MAQIKRVGFGQVEPNHLTAQKTGQIYAQLPADNSVFGTGDTKAEQDRTAQLENGMFVKYDYATNTVNLEGKGDWMMVFNEIKNYDERKQGLKHFCYKAIDFFDKQMFPRVIRLENGDIYTTNTFGKNTSDSAEVEGIELDLGDLVTVDPATGYLVAGDGREDGLPTFQVGKVYTMPDGQPGVKIQKIA